MWYGPVERGGAPARVQKLINGRWPDSVPARFLAGDFDGDKDYRVPRGLTLDELGSIADMIAQHEVVGVEIGEFEAGKNPASDLIGPGSLGACLGRLSCSGWSDQ